MPVNIKISDIMKKTATSIGCKDDPNVKYAIAKPTIRKTSPVKRIMIKILVSVVLSFFIPIHA